ncbi:hypothetical protein RJT34_11857 [Clitoria ternatea]|uniref:Uncharacterized protein n=1 Tax=Clitoria ternatea TaxID=43366 RepID=A0AAN9JND3_CLITE
MAWLMEPVVGVDGCETVGDERGSVCRAIDLSLPRLPPNYVPFHSRRPTQIRWRMMSRTLVPTPPCPPRLPPSSLLSLKLDTLPVKPPSPKNLKVQFRFIGLDQKDDKKNEQHDNEPNANEEEKTTGFRVQNAVLFPPEVENGRWPEDYSLSDHARLTVVFSPMRVPCTQLNS